MGEFDGPLAVGCVAVFTFFMGVAANIGVVESIFFIDFRQDLANVGSPSVAVAEIAITIFALSFLVAGVIFLVRE